MLKNIKSRLKTLPRTVQYGLAVLFVWELILILRGVSWTNYFLLISGAVSGYLIMEIDWVFPKKEVKQLLPLILLPLTIFVLTSTNGILGKSIVVFLNLRLIIERIIENET